MPIKKLFVRVNDSQDFDATININIRTNTLLFWKKYKNRYTFIKNKYDFILKFYDINKN